MVAAKKFTGFSRMLPMRNLLFSGCFAAGQHVDERFCVVTCIIDLLICALSTLGLDRHVDVSSVFSLLIILFICYWSFNSAFLIQLVYIQILTAIPFKVGINSSLHCQLTRKRFAEFPFLSIFSFLSWATEIRFMFKDGSTSWGKKLFFLPKFLLIL